MAVALLGEQDTVHYDVSCTHFTRHASTNKGSISVAAPANSKTSEVTVLARALLWKDSVPTLIKLVYVAFVMVRAPPNLLRTLGPSVPSPIIGLFKVISCQLVFIVCRNSRRSLSSVGPHLDLERL